MSMQIQNDQTYLLQMLQNGQVAIENEKTGAREQLTTDELNARLRHYSPELSFQNDRVVRSSGQSNPYVDPVMNGAADGAPLLPDTRGATLSEAELGDKVEYLASNESISDAALLFHALSALREKYERMHTLGMKGGLALSKAAEAMQEGRINAKAKSLSKQRTSSWINMGVQIGAAVAGMKAGQAFSQAVSSIGSTIDKQWGPGRQADDLNLQAQRYEMLAKSVEQVAQRNEQMTDDMKRAKDNALKILRDHFKLQTENVKSYTR